MTAVKYSGAYSNLNGASCIFDKFNPLGPIVTDGGVTGFSFTVNLTAESSYEEYLFLFTSSSNYVSGTYLETGYTEQDAAYAFNGTSTRLAATSTTRNTYIQSWSQGSGNYASCLIPYNTRSFSSITFSSVNSTTPSSVSASAGNVVIVAILSKNDPNVNFTPPSGYTLVENFGYQGSQMGVAYKLITTTGTESPGAWGGASATAANTHGCYTILLV